MSKSLRNMSNSERIAAIQRRIKNNTRGLGFWAAMDALPKESARLGKLIEADRISRAEESK